MGERTDRVIRIRTDIADNESVTVNQQDAEVQQTREEMSETLDAIEAKLAPARLTDDARDAAIETVDHVVEEAEKVMNVPALIGYLGNQDCAALIQ